MRLTVNACPRRKFRNAHVYHINSISVNSDQETFLSADDLRINLWHLEVNDKSFSILCGRWMTLPVARRRAGEDPWDWEREERIVG